MAMSASSVAVQALRFSTYRTPSRAQKFGTAAAMGYCCLAFSTPFAGAAFVSQRAGTDKRYAKLRPLSFRDCLPCSPLEDYAGALKH